MKADGTFRLLEFPADLVLTSFSVISLLLFAFEVASNGPHLLDDSEDQ